MFCCSICSTSVFFFYQGFISQKLTIQTTAGEGRELSFNPLYHFTRLLLNEIYFLIEFPFD